MPEPTDQWMRVDQTPRRRHSRTAEPVQALTRRQLREREVAEAEAEAEADAEAVAQAEVVAETEAVAETEEPSSASGPIEPVGNPDGEPDGEPRMLLGRRARRELAAGNVETVPLEIDLVPQHPVFEIETAEHIATEIVHSAEVDFAELDKAGLDKAGLDKAGQDTAEPHVAVEPVSAVATTAEDAPSVPVLVNKYRVVRSVPVAELLASSSGTFVSHARFRPIKRRLLAGFVMMIAAMFVVSLSIPTFGLGLSSDFASVQRATDVTDSQNLSVGEGPALAAARDDFYAVGAPGSLYSTTNSTVSKEAQKLATELMAAVAAGRLRGSAPDHIPEIQALADGVVKPDCGIDLRILQVMVLAVRNFDTVAVSDINRKCTGQIEGAGTGSSHYVNGGGHAVDFYLLNGSSLPGADKNTITFAELLDPLMPPGSNLGQSECRASAGIDLNLVNLREFPDSCTHMHVDVGSATRGLSVNLDTLIAAPTPTLIPTATPSVAPAPTG